MVTLETAAGKIVKLKAEMLLEADRALLNTHFSDKAAAVVLRTSGKKGDHGEAEEDEGFH